MRVLTWNINGVRTLPQYHPWNTLKTFDDILNHLNSDVICFQEMKSSRQGLPKQVALPSSYDSFFSFPVKKTGYSGVAVYTRRSAVVPLKAEEGLSGVVQPRPPLSGTERISSPSIYPPQYIGPNHEDFYEVDYKDLDGEGRGLVIDLGLFVLINVYCPNDGTGSEEREKFKMEYHRLLETRVRGFIREGREVMVVGDLNACAAVEDHCEGWLMVERGLAEGLQGEEGFWGKDSRRWIRDLLIKPDGTTGCMVDIVKKLWPDRKGMYTCWNTKISARETNYGTRIDFILITPGLVPWVEGADIQPQLKGSDHCPVFVDFREEITNSDGTVSKLSDLLGASRANGEPAEPPRLAAKFWDEHKQKLLSTFFGKKSEDIAPTPTPTVIPLLATSTSSNASSRQSSQSATHISDTADPMPSSSPQVDLAVEASQMLASSTIKRKLTVDNGPVSTKKTKIFQTQRKDNGKLKAKSEAKAGQSSIANFFSQPKSSTSQVPSLTSSSKKGKTKVVHSSSVDLSTPTEVDEDADYQFALLLSQSDDAQQPPPPSSSPGSIPDKAESKQAWNTLLAPTLVPNCIVHQEPAKEYTVNKPGPNKGKKFFLCSRPVGPGYDRGPSERLREQVDSQWKCNFFKWSNDVRKEMSRNGHP